MTAENNPVPVPHLVTNQIAAPRFLALDVFRGITVCLMIIVNSPGKGASNFDFLVHAKWFGFTAADFVFPSFLFAVGTSLAFTLPKLAHHTNQDFLIITGRRALLIFLLGFLMYWFPFVQYNEVAGWTFKPLTETRVMGVLQRIALCYFIAAVILRFTTLSISFILAGIFLLGYWIVLLVFGEAGSELLIQGNAVTRLDLLVLGENHIYKKDVVPFDPEGLLSSVPAVVNVLAGYWIGFFVNGKTVPAIRNRLLAISLLVLSSALLWALVFPVCKKLWTSSFVLLTIGLDILLILVLMMLTSESKPKWTKFFTVAGANPLFIYLLSELLYTTLNIVTIPGGESIFSWVSIHVFQVILPGTPGAFTTGVCFMLCCWCVAWWLDRRKIYIRI
jgi:predicted acyltransferase